MDSETALIHLQDFFVQQSRDNLLRLLVVEYLGPFLLVLLRQAPSIFSPEDKMTKYSDRSTRYLESRPTGVVAHTQLGQAPYMEGEFENNLRYPYTFSATCAYMNQGVRLVSFDESSFDGFLYPRKSWSFRGKTLFRSD